MIPTPESDDWAGVVDLGGLEIRIDPETSLAGAAATLLWAVRADLAPEDPGTRTSGEVVLLILETGLPSEVLLPGLRLAIETTLQALRRGGSRPGSILIRDLREALRSAAGSLDAISLLRDLDRSPGADS